MNQARDRIFRTITTLDSFVNKCLDLTPKGPTLSGFEYNIETVGSRADSLHLAIKAVPPSNFYGEVEGF